MVSKTLFDSWWVLLFALFCCMGYELGSRASNEQYLLLSNKWEALQQEKNLALLLQEELLLEVNSHSESCWQELTLRKELGLSPKGERKIFFSDSL